MGNLRGVISPDFAKLNFNITFFNIFVNFSDMVWDPFTAWLSFESSVLPEREKGGSRPGDAILHGENGRRTPEDQNLMGSSSPGRAGDTVNSPDGRFPLRRTILTLPPWWSA